MAVRVRFVRLESYQRQPNRMPGRQQHGSQQNRHVVAVAGLEFQHSSGRVQQFHSKNVARVPNVASNPIEECTNFPVSILGRNSIVAKDLNGFLSDHEILGSFLNHSGDDARRY